MRKHKEKTLYEQIRKPLPPPKRIITPQKGKGTYNRKKEKCVDYPVAESYGILQSLSYLELRITDFQHEERIS